MSQAGREAPPSEASAVAEGAAVVGTPLAPVAWKTARVTAEGIDWLRIERVGPTGIHGAAWARYSDALEFALAARVRSSPSPDPDTASARLAAALIASANLSALCREHQLPLALWLGGSIRDQVPVSLPLLLRTRDRAERAAELARQCARLRELSDEFGVSAFTIHDDHPDGSVIARSLAAVRDAAGPETALTLRLAGQLSVADARALQDRLRPHQLLALVDPCVSLAMAVEATRDNLPALGLSADRYDRQALLHCLATAPPALLIIDPLREGGALAVRELAGIARVLQVDVGLTAEDGGAWLAELSAVLASALPASHQPIQLPFHWTNDLICAFAVSNGRRPVPATFPLSPQDVGRPAPAGAAARDSDRR